jgi:Fe-S-cluster-containing dehydrogenase component
MPGDDEEVNAMQKWNMIIDVAECTNCNLCTLAVMDEYVGNAWPGYAAPMPKHGHKWINILQKERGQVPMIDIAYVPTMCNHCDDPPCMAKAGDAVKKREDGIVLIDPEKAKGRKDLVAACPYGHIWWNEELQLPQVEDDEMARLAREQDLEVMKSELGTRPRVYYRNLWRYSKCFIGGTLAAETSGVVDCVEGASVRLSKDGRTIAETTSDNYGDFKFDKLDEGSGTYVVEISAKGRSKKSVEARLGNSINLGEIRL